jgi:hypothetical protein
MARACTHGQMDVNLTASIRTIRKTAKGHFTGRMVASTTGAGRMVDSMAKACLSRNKE